MNVRFSAAKVDFGPINDSFNKSEGSFYANSGINLGMRRDSFVSDFCQYVGGFN